MRTNRATVVAAVLTAALAAAGCNRTVTGSGGLVSRQFSRPFEKIVVVGPFDVRVGVGPVSTVTVRTNANLANDVAVQIAQDTAHIELAPRIDVRSATLQARIVAPSIAAIDVSSSARVALADPLRGGKVSLSVDGDSRLDGPVDVRELDLAASEDSSLAVSGRADELTVEGDSSARIDAGAVRASSVEMHLDREATANVWATATVKVELSRDSRATYRGSPMFEERKLSSGATLRPSMRS